MLCVASVVFYASKDGARRHPWVVGAFCGLWQADISYPLTTGHDTEQPDSTQHMILITSSMYRLTSTAAGSTQCTSGICLSLGGMPSVSLFDRWACAGTDPRQRVLRT